MEVFPVICMHVTDISVQFSQRAFSEEIESFSFFPNGGFPKLASHAH